MKVPSTKRTVWARKETAILSDAFSTDPYLSEERATELAELLNRPARTVKTWFRNKRRKRSSLNTSSSIMPVVKNEPPIGEISENEISKIFHEAEIPFRWPSPEPTLLPTLYLH